MQKIIRAHFINNLNTRIMRIEGIQEYKNKGLRANRGDLFNNIH